MPTSTTLSRQQLFVNQVLTQSAQTEPFEAKKTQGTGKAPVNIALSKYWGKRDIELNLPLNGSVSISLPGLGTETEISLIEAAEDKVLLNNEPLPAEHAFAKRVSKFLDLFRGGDNQHFAINTYNSVPTAAGLASSASGYAALVLALNDLFDWQLNGQQLSLLARLGSGSASRSLFNGFALWHKGENENGLDSFAEAIDTKWPEFCIGLVEVDIKEKPLSSTQGMQNTVNTCDLYQAWPEQANRDMQSIIEAIQTKDFAALGKTAEHNALSMHATMIATWPPIVYWQAESVTAMHKVWQLREQGIEIFFTMDAGPNLKLLFLEKQKPAIKQAFGDIRIIEPFKD
ncbi:diphosphomevalonate decarboxylase [Thiomicrorhabdus sediminis]|uniref:diphosphomevalonate decarboxylase n=1 Tax=Thiomicrorhabdus sediminis TaxID=2580412 RepID=A0A4P9K6I7_9GAMM|nr:diphosphomevalonate decarboxylase [Thiomicrorhabdus sediminis]QCU90672.1 diphosphomevalonate decarboxylase [Thiomicrorhabdus sediminis]